MLSLLLFSCTLSAFALFFYAIGTRPIAVVCGIVLVGFIGGSIGTHTIKQGQQQLSDLIQTNGLMIARFLLVTGLSVALSYFGIHIQALLVGLLISHLGLWIISHLVMYDDGKKVFGASYILLLCGTIGWIRYINPALSGTVERGRYTGQYLHQSLALPLTLALIPFHLGIYGFLSFAGSCFQEPNPKLRQTTYVLFHLTIMLAILRTTRDINLFRLLIAQCYLTGVYYITYYFRNTAPPSSMARLTAEDILAGKKVFEYLEQKKKEPDRSRRLSTKDFIIHLPHRVRSVLYIGNIALILGAIWLYFKNLTTTPTFADQTIYWSGIIVFFINFLLIKKTSQSLHMIHRLSGFIIIHFAVYSNIIFVAGLENWNMIALIGIIWNYLNGLMMTKTEGLIEKGFLLSSDYRYRTWTNIAGLIINCFLLTKTTLPGQLIFAVVCAYLGSFGFLTYYNIKYIYENK